MRQTTKEGSGIFFFNIGRAVVKKRAYVFTSEGRANHAGRCDGEAELGSVLRSDLLIPRALQKKESLPMKEFKQSLNDHAPHSVQGTHAL